MKYEGSDVNRLISTGLMQAGARSPSSHDVSVTRTAAPAPAATAAATAEHIPSVISQRMQLTGSVETPDELHIYGTIKGDVRAASLVIFKGGIVKGEVFAEAVTVHGTIEGSIQGKKVQLSGTAQVRGDIFHDTIGIEPGAQFEGASKRIPAPAAAVVANDASDASSEAA